MENIRNIVSLLLLTAGFISCNPVNNKVASAWSELPEVTNLDSLKQTDFVISLENPIADNRNIIYAPAFLYAWDKIREELKSPIIRDTTNSLEFGLLNQSISHRNSLTDTEYTVSSEIIDGAITARAFFNKTLPFENLLQPLDNPILFDTTKVAAFGMLYRDENIIKQTRILYYKDDNDFILKLIPKDQQHEIILVKRPGKYETLKDAITLTNNFISKGKKEEADNTTAWKYQLLQQDVFSIPTIKFNIETTYKNIQGQNFLTADRKNHRVDLAYQRTGFILNENGAVAESVAVASIDSAAVEVIFHPKKMIFDKPFLIILKRADKTNPYFVMKITNPELLTRK